MPGSPETHAGRYTYRRAGHYDLVAGVTWSGRVTIRDFCGPVYTVRVIAHVDGPPLDYTVNEAEAVITD